MILNSGDLLDWVRSLMKTRQDNDVTNHTYADYTKNILNYWDLSTRVQSVMKTKHEYDMTDCTRVLYTENET